MFYGVRDLGPADGAPGPMRVFLPSLDGAVHTAPVLEGCGRYPLALLAHGNCAEVEHYRDWFELPAQLARSGCVVAVPELPHIAAGSGPFTDDHPDRLLLGKVMDWMHGEWRHAGVLRAAAHTGVIGHSWGPLLAGAFAAERNLAAYVSLSGAWSEWPSVPPSPLPSLDMPKLFTWGTGFGDLFSAIGDATWDSLPGTKHCRRAGRPARTSGAAATWSGSSPWTWWPRSSAATCLPSRGSATPPRSPERSRPWS